MSFSFRISEDSLNNSSSIHEGTSQCSAGINSVDRDVSSVTLRVVKVAYHICILPSFLLESVS